MNIEDTGLLGVQVITPDVHEDERGFLFEICRANCFPRFVQDNLVYSTRGTLRGIHYQPYHPQGKLFTVISGGVYEVVVDVRRDSKTFGKWVAVTLSGYNHKMLYVPEGFACGTYCIQHSDMLYKTTDYYDPDGVVHIAWDDPDLAIPWPLDARIPIPTLSDDDVDGKTMKELFG